MSKHRRVPRRLASETALRASTKVALFFLAMAAVAGYVHRLTTT
jgi:hypothetical protein